MKGRQSKDRMKADSHFKVLPRNNKSN